MMEKKIWSKPEVSAVQFHANEFCVTTCVEFTVFNVLCDLIGKRVYFDNGDGEININLNEGLGKGSYEAMQVSTPGLPSTLANSDDAFMNNLLDENGNMKAFDYDQRFWQYGRGTIDGVQNDQFYHRDGTGSHTIQSTTGFETYDGWYHGGTTIEGTKKAYLFYDRANGIIHASSGNLWESQSRNRS